MHIIGKMNERTHRETGEVFHEGTLRLGTLKAPVRFVPAEKRKPSSPSHRVEIHRGGEWHPFGVAWMQAPKGGGEDYYSAKLSHPMWLRYEVPVTAFPPSGDEDNGLWSIVWTPPQARPAADPLASDEIRF